MNILKETQKREEKEQKEAAEKLIRVTDELISFLKGRDLAVWEIKSVHSLLGQRLTQMLNDFVDKKKISEVL